jgi:hypothetical protein
MEKNSFESFGMTNKTPYQHKAIKAIKWNYKIPNCSKLKFMNTTIAIIS